MSAQTQAELDLHQLGQQAYGSIIAAKKHDLKGANLWLSAGLLLIEAKKKVPHGGWMVWLKEHKISQDSSEKAQLIGRSKNPAQTYKEVRAKEDEVNKKVRAAKDLRANSGTDAGISNQTPSVTEPALIEVRRLLKGATEYQLLAVKDLLLKLRAIAHEERT